MIQRILVPLDGSELAEQALGTVSDLAKRLPAEVHLIHIISARSAVVPMDPAAGVIINPEVMAEELEAEKRAASEYLERVAQRSRSSGMTVHVAVLNGLPAQGTVEYAKSHDIDLIAMSTHGRSGFSRLIFGSVAEQVVRDAGRPVLLVRPKKGASGG